jgi:lysyl-tRNA synthetase class 2
MPSTAIHDHDYDPGTSRLTVTFVTGRIYEYDEVPPDVAADFSAARSKGEFFNAHIRNHYRYREVAATRG